MWRPAGVYREGNTAPHDDGEGWGGRYPLSEPSSVFTWRLFFVPSPTGPDRCYQPHRDGKNESPMVKKWVFNPSFTRVMPAFEMWRMR